MSEPSLAISFPSVQKLRACAMCMFYATFTYHEKLHLLILVAKMSNFAVKLSYLLTFVEKMLHSHAFARIFAENIPGFLQK